MQKHIVKKLVFRLHSGPGIPPGKLEHEVINIYHNRLERLLDERFTTLCAPDLEYRIDRLELDLGRMRPDNLRADMPRLVSEQLGRNLNNGALHAASVVPEQEKQLILFSHFIETGRRPWWAERVDKQTLEQTVETLCVEAPAKLKALMPPLVRDKRKLTRLVNHLSEQCLSRVCELYIPVRDAASATRQHSDMATVFAEMDRQINTRGRDALAQLPAAGAGRGGTRLKQRYWQGVLTSLVYGAADGSGYERLLPDTLVSMTGNNDAAYRSLIARLDSAIRSLQERGYKFSARLPQLVEELAASSQSREIIDRSIQRMNVQEDAVANSRISASGESLKLHPAPELKPSRPEKKAGETGRAGPPVKLEPSRSVKQAGSTDLTGPLAKIKSSRAEKEAGTADSTDPATTMKPARPERSSTPASAAGPATKMSSPRTRDKAGAAGALTDPARREIFQDPDAPATAGVERGAITDPFTDTDEDYVYNAGLVIVWPYLPRFFGGLGMLDNDEFIDVDTIERAALLLQYLAEPDTEIAESLLALNKLLCGLELSWPLPAEFTPTLKEQAGCDALLSALTRHWDILTSMSLERVRRDFFQRQGILRPRDGNWQLQVEHQTHDILMRKLTWPVGTVKLPWMDYTLFVQWD